MTAGGSGDVIDAKWTELPDARDARGVRDLMTQARDRGVKELTTSRGWIVCRTAEPHPLPGDGPRVDAVSLDRFVAALEAGAD